MPPVSRQTDTISHSGAPITSGSSTVTINGLPAARFNDTAQPHNKHRSVRVAQGSSKVRVNGLPLAFLGALTSCRATIATGSATVTVGSGSITARTIGQLNTRTIAQANITKIGEVEL